MCFFLALTQGSVDECRSFVFFSQPKSLPSSLSFKGEVTSQEGQYKRLAVKLYGPFHFISTPPTPLCKRSIKIYPLRADVCKYRPEARNKENIKILQKIHKVALRELLTEIYFLLRSDNCFRRTEVVFVSQLSDLAFRVSHRPTLGP